MANITSLKEAYVIRKVSELINIMKANSWLNLKVSTCDYSNWDRDLHFAMPDIADSLKIMGYNVSSSVNYGVTDWIITVK